MALRDASSFDRIDIIGSSDVPCTSKHEYVINSPNQTEVPLGVGDRFIRQKVGCDNASSISNNSSGFYGDPCTSSAAGYYNEKSVSQFPSPSYPSVDIFDYANYAADDDSVFLENLDSDSRFEPTPLDRRRIRRLESKAEAVPNGNVLGDKYESNCSFIEVRMVSPPANHIARMWNNRPTLHGALGSSDLGGLSISTTKDRLLKPSSSAGSNGSPSGYYEVDTTFDSSNGPGAAAMGANNNIPCSETSSQSSQFAAAAHGRNQLRLELPVGGRRGRRGLPFNKMDCSDSQLSTIDAETLQQREQVRKKVRRLVTIVAVTLTLMCIVLIGISLSLGQKIDDLVQQRLEHDKAMISGLSHNINSNATFDNG